MTSDDFLHDICIQTPPPPADPTAKAMDDEVWREITGRRGDGGSAQLTLEDFLARNSMEDAAAEARVSAGYGADPAMGTQILGFCGAEGSGEEVRRGRASKRMMVESADKATLQRQKRMIKNRESAARSRERKQAYTAELETIVARLEEENAQLIRAQEEQHQKRLNQLLKTLIPVTEMKKPRRCLQRNHSAEW